MLAFQSAVVPVKSYTAYEIDKYAIQTTVHNFPEVEECGDVFTADFLQYKDIDYLIGGSPCQHWSIAQHNNRETTANGIGWELFSQYVRALRDVKPKYFIYENNKSMAKAVRDSITKEFGFDAICINSALVSAQSRQRLYWVGKRNDDGTYSKVNVDQPEDRGIFLKDILDGITDREKERAVIGSTGRTTTREYFKKFQGNMAFETVKGIPICTSNGKSHVLRANPGGGAISHDITKSNRSFIAEPVIDAAQRGRYNENGEVEQTFEVREDNKSNCVTTVNKDCMVAVGVDSAKQVGALPRPNGELSTSQGFRIYDTEGKSVTLKGNAGGAGGKTGLYAIDIEYHGYAQPCEWDENGIPTKAISGTDGKKYVVYEVKDGQIAIKDKTYPIKLKDGYYIIRKLTVTECKRLQTVPEWYEFPVSDSQAYKMLGNGWSVEVIAHLIRSTLQENT